MATKEIKKPVGRPVTVPPDKRKKSESVSISAETKRKVIGTFGSLGAALEFVARDLSDPTKEKE